MTTHVDLLMDRFRAVYGIGKITPELFVEFEVVLADMPAALVHAAGDEWIGRSKWPPTPAEVADIVRRLEAEASPYEPEPEHWRRNTYACQVCRDTGYVTVWHPTAMQSAIWYVRGKIAYDRIRLPTCDARCDCTIGRAKPSGKPNRKLAEGLEPPQPVFYQSPPMIHVDPAMDSYHQVETLLDWARGWQPKPQAGDRVSEFDQWNREEF